MTTDLSVLTSSCVCQPFHRQSLSESMHTAREESGKDSSIFGPRSQNEQKALTMSAVGDAYGYVSERTIFVYAAGCSVQIDRFVQTFLVVWPNTLRLIVFSCLGSGAP